MAPKKRPKPKAKTVATPQPFATSETLTTIQLRRGNEANLPASAASGEPLFCLDSKKLFAGMGDGTPPVEIASSLGGVPVDENPPTDGQILIYDHAENAYAPGDPIVSGPDAPGGPPTRPPVQIGVVDGSGNVQRASGTSGGAQNVVGVVSVSNLPATQPVSGSVAVTNLPATQPVSGSVAVSNFPSPQASASSAETSTVYNGVTALTPQFVKISASASGNNNVLAAVSSKRIRVLRWDLTASGAVNAKFQSNAATDLTGLYYFAQNGGIAAGFCPVGIFQTGVGETLDLNLSAAIAVGGVLTYVTV
jgi:hypothetical protein